MAFPSLQSGVVYETQQPNIQRGAESIYGALGQITGQKIKDEERKQAIYQDLLNIGLDEVKGKYQDEAAGMKAALLKRTAQMFADTEGIPSAEQMKEITLGKNKLTNYAKMYQGMEDWYRQASMQAAQIPSRKYRGKTIANITDIMSKPTLSDTWDAILNKPWLELPPPDIDVAKIRKGILENADEVNNPFEPGNRDKYGNISYEAWQNKDTDQIRLGAEDAWNNIEGLKERFPDLESWVDYIGTGTEYQNKIIKPNVGRGSSEKKKPEIKYNPVTKQYEWADINSGKGLPVAEFTNLGGENVPLKDATITMARPDPNTPNDLTPKEAKVVSPSLMDLSIDDLTKGMSDDDKANYVKWIFFSNPNILTKTTKDPLRLTELWVPFDLVKSYTDRNLNIIIPKASDVKQDTDPARIK